MMTEPDIKHANRMMGKPGTVDNEEDFTPLPFECGGCGYRWSLMNRIDAQEVPCPHCGTYCEPLLARDDGGYK